MTEKSSKRLFTRTAGIVSLAGPAAMALSETGHLHLFPNSSLGEMWLLAAIGASGVVIGILAVAKGARAAGIICILTNAPVLALYGFIASFFAEGHSR